MGTRVKEFCEERNGQRMESSFPSETPNGENWTQKEAKKELTFFEKNWERVGSWNLRH